MNRVVGRTTVVFVAAVFALSVAAPAVAYNNANARNINMSRVDSVQCGTKIEIKAKVVNGKGKAVKNVWVRFNIKGPWGRGIMGPNKADKSTEQTVTNNKGFAKATPEFGKVRPWIRIWCSAPAGWWTVKTKATKPSDARGKLTFYCGPEQGCGGGALSASLDGGAVSLLSPPPSSSRTLYL